MYYLLILVLLFLAELFYLRWLIGIISSTKPNERSSHTSDFKGGRNYILFQAVLLTSGFEYPWLYLRQHW